MRRPKGWMVAAVVANAIAGVALAATATLASPSSRSAANAAVRASSERAAQVIGSVIDREGAAVAGATVVARPVGLPVSVGVGARVFETMTDACGHFRLDGLPPGTYWFLSFHTAHPTGSSPALPVAERIEIVIRLDDEQVRS